jgi:hypothetical protein
LRPLTNYVTFFDATLIASKKGLTMKRLLFMLGFVSVFVVPVQAQAVAGCDAEGVAAAIEAVLAAASAAQAENDPKAAVDILAAVSGQVSGLQATCNGLSFTDTQPALLGPIEFPAGIYRAIATTDNFFIAQITVVEGECGQGSGRRLGESLFILSKDEATAGAESLFTSNGCTALIEISNVQSEWTLQFELLS